MVCHFLSNFSSGFVSKILILDYEIEINEISIELLILVSCDILQKMKQTEF